MTALGSAGIDVDNKCFRMVNDYEIANFFQILLNIIRIFHFCTRINDCI